MPMPHPVLLFLLLQGAAAADPSAPAGAGAPAATSPFGGMLLPLLLCAVVFYFLVIGPERKQRKKRDAMLRELGKGAKVMTTGGLYATVVGVQDDVLTLQIAEGVRARFARSAIQTVVDEETGEKPAEAAIEKGEKKK